MSESPGDSLIPQVGDTSVFNPVTFEQQGGITARMKSNLFFAIGGTLFATIASLIILFNNPFPLNFLVSAAVFYGVTLAIRYIFLKEKNYRRVYQNLAKTGNSFHSANYWGIHDIDEESGLCRYQSGYTGVFIRAEKSVIVGKTDKDEFNHFEALSSAINLATYEGALVSHIDLMDNLGADPRIQASISGLSSCTNSDLKDVVTDIFVNLGESAKETFNSYDIFVLRYKGNDRELERIIGYFTTRLMGGNFKSFEVLDSQGILQLTKSVFNLNNFSISEASSKSFAQTEVKMIRPIQLRHVDGSIEKLGKTSEEMVVDARNKSAESAAIKREEERLKMERKSGRRSNKGGKSVSSSKGTDSEDFLNM